MTLSNWSIFYSNFISTPTSYTFSTTEASLTDYFYSSELFSETIFSTTKVATWTTMMVDTSYTARGIANSLFSLDVSCDLPKWKIFIRSSAERELYFKGYLWAPRNRHLS